jgi:hypothetical protein
MIIGWYIPDTTSWSLSSPTNGLIIESLVAPAQAPQSRSFVGDHRASITAVNVNIHIRELVAQLQGCQLARGEHVENVKSRSSLTLLNNQFICCSNDKR